MGVMRSVFMWVIDLEGAHQVRPNHVGLVRLSAELPAARTAETLGGIF
jgi:hypothetical protein